MQLELAPTGMKETDWPRVVCDESLDAPNAGLQDHYHKSQVISGPILKLSDVKHLINMI